MDFPVFRFTISGKLSGGHQAAVMCMAVGKLTNEEDLVITGSKDHYIKVYITLILLPSYEGEDCILKFAGVCIAGEARKQT